MSNYLADDAYVSLTVYDVKGNMVKWLDVGYYTNKIQAAYWEGRNNLGELVGSGAYYYQLKTGGFSSTRKMVILK